MARKAATEDAPAKKPRRAKKESEPKPEPEARPRANPGRPIWSGSIAFGLVNVPVTLHALEQKSDLSFKLLDSRDHSGIRYERVNEVTGKEVPWDQIVKGYEYSDDNYVVLSDEDFKRVAVEASKQIDVQGFVPRDAIDDLYFDKPYVLLPKKKAEKGYVLLREIMRRSGTAAIARVVIRTREHLAAVEPKGQALVVVLLRFHQELRDVSAYDLPDADPAKYNISDRELQLAEQLVAAMTADWQPESYHDEYREALMAWIEQKATSGGLTPIQSADADEGTESTNVIDLADLLRKSMQAKKGA